MEMTLPRVMIPKINWQWILKMGVFLLLFSLLLGNLITLSYGIENLRFLHVFSSDEANGVKQVLTNLKYDDLNPRGFYHYGYFYQTIGFYIVKTLKYFGFTADAMLVALVLRLISLISYALAGIIIYKLYIKSFKGSKEFALILAFFLLSIPSFSFWNRWVHPDMFQVLLILLAAWTAFSTHRAAQAIMASALIGAAFGTKYSGIFLFPFLLLPYVLSLVSTSPKNKKFRLKIIFTATAAVLVFLTMWIITNPYMLTYFKAFQADFLFEKEHVARGHGMAAPGNPFLWFVVLKDMLGPVNCTIVGIGVILALGTLIVGLKRDGIKKFLAEPSHRNLFTIMLYVITAFLYIMIEVRLREPRYLFHILPFMLLIALHGIQKMTLLFKRDWLKSLVLIGLFFSILTLSWQSIREASTVTCRHYHQRIKAGKFLARHEDGHLRVLADPYSYVPPKFKYAVFLFRIDEEKIKKYRPDLIVLNANATQRWSWKKRGTSFRDLKLIKGSYDNAEHYYRFQKRLFSPRSSWDIIYETNHVVILKKNPR